MKWKKFTARSLKTVDITYPQLKMYIEISKSNSKLVEFTPGIMYNKIDPGTKIHFLWR